MPKFSEIPKLIKSNYRIYVPLSHVSKKLVEWQYEQEGAGYKFELNPLFQRGHVWSVQQQIAYVEWLLRGGATGLEIYFNHPAWFSDYKADMVCVDGLQRLTAVQRFLNNEIPAFESYLCDYEDKLPTDVALYFNVGCMSEKAVIRWYLEMNFTGTPHSPEELARVRKLL